MGISSVITSQIESGFFLIVKIIKWIVITALSVLIAFGIYWLLRNFGVLAWLFKPKKKKEEEKQENGNTN